jgi:hypothetical protein
VCLVHLPLTIWIAGLLAPVALPAFVKGAFVLAVTVCLTLWAYDRFVRSTAVGALFNARLRGAPASAIHARRPSSGRARRLAPDEGRNGPGRRRARQLIERCPHPSSARGVPRHGHRSALGTGRSGLDERLVDLCDRPERLKGRVRRDTDVERCLSPLPLMIVRNRCAWGLGVCAPG